MDLCRKWVNNLKEKCIRVKCRNPQQLVSSKFFQSYLYTNNIIKSQWAKSPKIAEKAVCRSLFLKCTPSDCFLAILPTGIVIFPLSCSYIFCQYFPCLLDIHHEPTIILYCLKALWVIVSHRESKPII